MDVTQAEALFQPAVVLRIADPHRSPHDRRSSLTAAAAIGYGERRVVAVRHQASEDAVQAIWRPGR